MFYFHWVDVGHTFDEWLAASTWTDAYAVKDAQIITLEIEHRESQIPSANITIKNPLLGILAPGRPVWAWIAADMDGRPQPLFFGHVVGVPSDLFGEAITLTFTARSLYYIPNKQIAAEALKVRPFWDPVFMDFSKRDDPDAILEGYSAVWHVDRVSQAISASDIIDGEDGTAIFTPAEVPYSSVKMKLGQVPLSAVAVEATISWTQAYTGFLQFTSGQVKSYSGDGFVNDWPKPLQSLGAGWNVFSSFAIDAYKIASAPVPSWSIHWENKETSHNTGDWMSYDLSETVPVFFTTSATTDPNSPQADGVIQYPMTVHIIPGLIDPNTVDINGNPAPTNRPDTAEITYNYVPLWTINYYLSLRYEASRPRTERVFFTLVSGTQPVLAVPQITETTEIMTPTSADVGLPILNLKNWSSVAGQRVELGDFIAPDNPQVAGQNTIQICVQAGIAGLVEPVFSLIAGHETTDGTVIWSSYGVGNPNIESVGDWQQNEIVPVGQIILPRPRAYALYADIVAPGLNQVPRVGTAVSLYTIVKVDAFYECTVAGTTGINQPSWGSGVVVFDGSVIWQKIAATMPSGKDYYISIRAGETGQFLPAFTGTTTTDGGVVWRHIAVSEAPVGGVPGLIPAASYVTQDRGRWSLENLICRARARIRKRARCVELSFGARFEQVAKLSCRMNATLYDRRIPGGFATGKVIAYRLRADGDTATIIGNVTIGCAVGTGGFPETDLGTGTYAQDGYMQPGYQQMDGFFALPPGLSDVAYEPPQGVPVDDGIKFPLVLSDVLISSPVIRGDTGLQSKKILKSLQEAAAAENLFMNAFTGQQLIFSEQRALLVIAATNQAAEDSVAVALQNNPVYLEAELKPLSGQKFDNAYSVIVSQLHIAQQINLEAVSNIATPPLSGIVHQATVAFAAYGQMTESDNVPLGHSGFRLSGNGASTCRANLIVQPWPSFNASGAITIRTVATFQSAVEFDATGRAGIMGRGLNMAAFSFAGESVFYYGNAELIAKAESSMAAASGGTISATVV